MKNDSILVTGGAGFIGSHIIERLLVDCDSQIIVIDDLSTGKIDNLPGDKRVVFFEKSVNDKKAINKLFKKFKFSYIFHEAAIPSVQKSIQEPLNTHLCNCVSTIDLLEHARDQGCLKKFIFASSAAVYGDYPEFPKTEDSPIAPLSPYGIDKYSSEKYILFFNRNYKLPSAILRYFNVYGPRQDPGSPYSGVISIFVKNFLNSEDVKLTIYGDGEQTRDFIFIDDIVNANMLMMKNTDIVGGVFNTATGQSSSLLQLVAVLEEISGKKAKINFEKSRHCDINHSGASIEKITKYGFKPDFSLYEGLVKYIKSISN